MMTLQSSVAAAVNIAVNDLNGFLFVLSLRCILILIGTAHVLIDRGTLNTCKKIIVNYTFAFYRTTYYTVEYIIYIITQFY